MMDGVNASPLSIVKTYGCIYHSAFFGSINSDSNKIHKILFQCYLIIYNIFCFKQKMAYDVRISDWSSDVCSSDLERCRFIMVDPKMLELSVYDGIPHLLSPVVTDPKKAVVALKWTVREMESRYRAMSKLGVRNIEGYNARLAEAVKKGETLKRRVQTGFDADTGKPVFEEEPLDLTPLPFIVVVIDRSE